MKKKGWIKTEEALPTYEEDVVCLYPIRSGEMIYDSDYIVAFNHRSENPYVMTTENGWCNIELVFSATNEPTYWISVPDTMSKE